MKRSVETKNLPYSITVDGDTITIKNGVQSVKTFFKNTFNIVANCIKVKHCAPSSFRVLKEDQVLVWGFTAQCTDMSPDTATLSPAKFGFETDQELVDYINELLAPQLEFVDGSGGSASSTSAGWQTITLPGAPANEVIQCAINNSGAAPAAVALRKVGSTVNVTAIPAAVGVTTRLVETDKDGAIQVNTLFFATTAFSYAGHLKAK